MPAAGAPELPRARLGPSGTLAARLNGEPVLPVIRTLADLKADPERLIDAADMARVGLVGSYGAISRWVASGGLSEPYRMPSGRMAWRAGDVLAAVAPRAGGSARDALAETASDAGTGGAVATPPLPVAMTVLDAARYCGLSKSSLYEALARGDIAGVRAGRRTLILTASLCQHIERQPPYTPTLGRKAG
jgi:excisionase family DNA binding protein